MRVFIHRELRAGYGVLCPRLLTLAKVNALSDLSLDLI